MTAEYMLPIINNGLPLNERRRLVRLLVSQDTDSPVKKKAKSAKEKKLESVLIKHITKKR